MMIRKKEKMTPMKKVLLATAALVALPVMAQAQSQPNPGFYIGAEGGLNWMFNTTANAPGFGGAANIYPATGWAAGGMIGYDFVGPRVELEGIYRSNQATLQAAPIGFQQFTAGANINDTAIMANIMYDFRLAGRSFPTSAPAPALPSSTRPPWAAARRARSSPIRASSAWATKSIRIGASTSTAVTSARPTQPSTILSSVASPTTTTSP